MPPPLGADRDERRLLWLDADRYRELAAAATARGVTVDALVEELLADVAPARRS